MSEQKQYTWRRGSRVRPGIDPQAVGEQLEALEQQHGVVMPETVVLHAADPASPLHPWFEWDDGEAANQYRVAQAREMSRSLCVVVVRVQGETKVYSEPIQAYVHASDRGYNSAAVVRENPEMRERVIRQVRGELASARSKCEQWGEWFEGVLEPIMEAESRLEQAAAVAAGAA